MPGHDEEHVLVQRLREGDASAVAELVSAYRPRIEHQAFRYLRNREDAEDVAQDVLFKISASIGAFRGDAAFTSWIYRMTFNAAMSHLRHARTTPQPRPPARLRRAHGAGGVQTEPEPADAARRADEVYWSRQVRQRLRTVLGALPVIYRIPIQLRDLRGLSTAQASQVLGVGHETLKSRLHRGRMMLRSELADFRPGRARRPSGGGVTRGAARRTRGWPREAPR